MSRQTLAAIIMVLALGILLGLSMDRADALTQSHTDCNFCHALHGAQDGVLFNSAGGPETLCLSCHGPAGPENISKVAIHNNSTSEYSAFSYSCVDCHGAHSYRYNWQGGLNANLVGRDSNDWPISALAGTYYTVINTPNSGIQNVVFESTTGLHSFADNNLDGFGGSGLGGYDGICEVCHTQTGHHTNSAPDNPPHYTGEDCTTCHSHVERFKAAGGTCVECHDGKVGTAPDEFRQITNSSETGPGDFGAAGFTSRHVFGATVSDWDCIVCHEEGDTSSSLGNIVTTSEHNDSGKTIAMRNVDIVNNPGGGIPFATNASNVGSWAVSYWRWPKPSHGPSNDDHTNMDRFCMSCHDSDGASGISTNAIGNGIELSSPISNQPFNDTLRTLGPGRCDIGGDTGHDAKNQCNGTGETWDDPYCWDDNATTKAECDAGVGDNAGITGVWYPNGGTPAGSAMPGGDLTAYLTTKAACEGKGFTWWDDWMCYDERSRVVDVKSQFNTDNPSHHAVLGQRYTTTNAGWGAGAWVANIPKSETSTDLKTLRETATLHCADCHTVDTNAHGGQEIYMLYAATIDGACWLCHSSTVYGKLTSALSRFDHNRDSRAWDDAKGSKLDPNTSGGKCLNCHGGAPYDGYGAIHGIATGVDMRIEAIDNAIDQERHRFIGGSYMSMKSDFTTTTANSLTCYMNTDSNNMSPWSNCDQHTPGTNGSDTPQYARDTVY
jgi:hypothetical protein